MQSSFDKGQPKKRKRRNRGDKFDIYRSKKPKSWRGKGLTSRDSKSISPSVRRSYRPTMKKRYKADDLNDNQSDGSLWAGDGNENYLFTQNNRKKNGDIIMIEVLGQMKKDIQAELKRAFPDRPKPKKKKDGDKKDGDKTAEKKKEEPAKAAVADTEGKVYDKVSSVIVEEINSDHILLRGRKHLLYKNRKRLIEVQALVARRDVNVSDTVPSDKVLESSIDILR